MARQSLNTVKPVKLVIPDGLWLRLYEHLFPGDSDEHGAVIAAGIAETERGISLLAHDVFAARDGRDYVPGNHGYRMLQPKFIYEKLHHCRENALCYLAVHNHGGLDQVAFSDIDLASHERGYPALLDIIGNKPVGAVVFATKAAAGDVWFPNGERLPLSETRIIGRNVIRLYSSPPPRVLASKPTYDRQVLLFGSAGQDILSRSKVGVIGVGGVGSLLVEYLAHLGVGNIVVVDEKRISKSNRSRMVGALEEDVRVNPPTPKISIAERVARDANPEINFQGIFGNFVKDHIAKQFSDCDFLFLAADSMQARLVFNALVHQYSIPGIQTGAKMQTNKTGNHIEDLFSVSRWVTPESGCLWCNGLIPRDLLSMEAKDEDARREQSYGTNQTNPSVITLNAICASHAANDFLMAFMNLVLPEATLHYQRFQHRQRQLIYDAPRKDENCLECGLLPKSRRAKGDSVDLPTICS